MEPEVGDVLIDPDGKEFGVLNKDSHGCLWVQGNVPRWQSWIRMQEKGWTLKEDKMAERGLWPDEAFQKAKAWANAVSARIARNPRTIESALYDEVRAEEKRREPQVCGAEAPFAVDGYAVQCSGFPHTDEERHTAWLGEQTAHIVTWYDPPQCEKPHVTEATQRVIEAARDAANHEHVVNLPNCLGCRLGKALSTYDREVKQ